MGNLPDKRLIEVLTKRPFSASAKIPIWKEFTNKYCIVAKYTCAKNEEYTREGGNLAVAVWLMSVRFLPEEKITRNEHRLQVISWSKRSELLKSRNDT